MRRRLITAVIATCACGKPAPLAPAYDPILEPQHATTRPLTQPPVLSGPEKLQMQQYDDDLFMIERELIAGRLREAKALAYLLARPAETWVAPWPPEARDVVQASLAVAAARNLDEALQRVPAIGAACARCHAESHQAPDLAPVPPQPDPRAPDAAAHRWAIDRVREGVIRGSDASWRRGLKALAAMPPPVAQVADEHAIAARLRALAGTEVDADVADRSAVWGDLLVTCTGCHTEGGSMVARGVQGSDNKRQHRAR